MNEIDRRRVVRRSVPAELYDAVVAVAAIDGPHQGRIVYEEDGELRCHHEDCGFVRLESGRDLARRLRARGLEQIFVVSTINWPQRPWVEVLIDGFQRPAIAERGFDKALPRRASALAA